MALTAISLSKITKLYAHEQKFKLNNENKLTYIDNKIAKKTQTLSKCFRLSQKLNSLYSIYGVIYFNKSYIGI